ncbi:MAG: undecaprenyl-diphosphate phosphatase [Alphaproteobacteria bacterium]|nr:undecaprenyl-diphosphate phosphatase [Alphaproteobacteria bacterium]
MPLFHLVLVALVQGITEFLPISSSAHLVLLPHVTGAEDQGLVIDIAVHIGTLLAVLLYLRHDFVRLKRGSTGSYLTVGRPNHLVGQVLLATIPVLLIGAVVHAFSPNGIRDVEVIAWATLAGAIVLQVADQMMHSVRRLDHMTTGAALMIGIAQALSLIPGASRAGMTMMAARALGFERTEAARFSLMLSIPVILAAGAVAVLDIVEAGNVALGADALLACGLACLAGYVAIAAMMRWLSFASFTPFVVYRIVLGLGLLAWIYVGGA